MYCYGIKYLVTLLVVDRMEQPREKMTGSWSLVLQTGELGFVATCSLVAGSLADDHNCLADVPHPVELDKHCNCTLHSLLQAMC